MFVYQRVLCFGLYSYHILYSINKYIITYHISYTHIYIYIYIYMYDIWYIHILYIYRLYYIYIYHIYIYPIATQDSRSGLSRRHHWGKLHPIPATAESSKTVIFHCESTVHPWIHVRAALFNLYRFYLARLEWASMCLSSCIPFTNQFNESSEIHVLGRNTLGTKALIQNLHAPVTSSHRPEVAWSALQGAPPNSPSPWGRPSNGGSIGGNLCVCETMSRSRGKKSNDDVNGSAAAPWWASSLEVPVASLFPEGCMVQITSEHMIPFENLHVSAAHAFVNTKLGGIYIPIT